MDGGDCNVVLMGDISFVDCEEVRGGPNPPIGSRYFRNLVDEEMIDSETDVVPAVTNGACAVAITFSKTEFACSNREASIHDRAEVTSAYLSIKK